MKQIKITIGRNKYTLLLRALKNHYQSIEEATNDPKNANWLGMNRDLLKQVAEMYDEVDEQYEG